MQAASSAIGATRWRRWLAAPSLCAICRSWSALGLCTACLQRFAAPQPRCQRCGRATATALARCGDCLPLDLAFEHCVTVSDYAAPWRELIAGFKYRQQVELASPLAAALSWAIDDAGAATPDWILPVPLSRERLRERGFNQAWELARRLGRRRGVPASASLLQRVRDTAHQIGKSREQRERNLRDAFWVDDRRGRRLAGGHVALVDDVMTTGATVHAAALALRRAGARAVDVWVVARTPLEPA